MALMATNWPTHSGILAVIMLEIVIGADSTTLTRSIIMRCVAFVEVAAMVMIVTMPAIVDQALVLMKLTPRLAKIQTMMQTVTN